MRYVTVLPMPPSVNAAHAVGKQFKYGKAVARHGSDRAVYRSSEYTDWLQYASIEFRKQFPKGVPEKLQGRIHIDYIFVFPTAAGDTDNRVKVCQDFLQGKFFDNDSQIDEPHPTKRIMKDAKGEKGKAIIIMTEIPDRRYDDPMILFKEILNREER